MTHHFPLHLEPTKDRTPDRVPAAAWVLALSCLADQLLLLAQVGVKPADDGLVLSMLIGAILTGWVASGVLHARTVRLVIAALILALGVLGDGIGCVTGGLDAVLGWSGVHLVASAVSLAALFWFVSSDYFQWQRLRPEAPGPSLTPLIGIAVLVGVLGGVVDTPEPASGIWIRVSL